VSSADSSVHHAALAATIENRLAEWRRLRRHATTQSRTVIQRIVRGRITFTPCSDGFGYHFTAPTRFDRLFSGIAVSRSTFSPMRIAAVWSTSPRRTRSTRIMGACWSVFTEVYGKGVASVMPVSWNQIAGWRQQIEAVRHAA
jgi:hypothetical protein